MPPNRKGTAGVAIRADYGEIEAIARRLGSWTESRVVREMRKDQLRIARNVMAPKAKQAIPRSNPKRINSRYPTRTHIVDTTRVIATRTRDKSSVGVWVGVLPGNREPGLYYGDIINKGASGRWRGVRWQFRVLAAARAAFRRAANDVVKDVGMRALTGRRRIG